MAQIRIPRSARSPYEAVYARLIRRILGDGSDWGLDGQLFRCGAKIDESELWPGDDYPSVPLLFECAGRDSAPLRRPLGGGRAVRPRLYILWRWSADAREWMEIARISAAGDEWIDRMSALVRLELARAPRPASQIEIAVRASNRWTDSLDRELEALDRDERVLALGYFYEEITARFAALQQRA